MTLYLSGTIAYCLFLLGAKFNDQECSKTDPISWLVIAIASSFWIIVIPISLLELFSKYKAKSQAPKQVATPTPADNAYLETTVSAS